MIILNKSINICIRCHYTYFPIFMVAWNKRNIKIDFYGL